jgi:hypothetical protein
VSGMWGGDRGKRRLARAARTDVQRRAQSITGGPVERGNRARRPRRPRLVVGCHGLSLMNSVTCDLFKQFLKGLELI